MAKRNAVRRLIDKLLLRILDRIQRAVTRKCKELKVNVEADTRAKLLKQRNKQPPGITERGMPFLSQKRENERKRQVTGVNESESYSLKEQREIEDFFADLRDNPERNKKIKERIANIRRTGVEEYWNIGNDGAVLPLSKMDEQHRYYQQCMAYRINYFKTEYEKELAKVQEMIAGDDRQKEYAESSEEITEEKFPLICMFGLQTNPANLPSVIQRKYEKEQIGIEMLLEREGIDDRYRFISKDRQFVDNQLPSVSLAGFPLTQLYCHYLEEKKQEALNKAAVPKQEKEESNTQTIFNRSQLYKEEIMEAKKQENKNEKGLSETEVVEEEFEMEMME